MQKTVKNEVRARDHDLQLYIREDADAIADDVDAAIDKVRRENMVASFRLQIILNKEIVRVDKKDGKFDVLEMDNENYIDRINTLLSSESEVTIAERARNFIISSFNMIESQD